MILLGPRVDLQTEDMHAIQMYLQFKSQIRTLTKHFSDIPDSVPTVKCRKMDGKQLKMLKDDGLLGAVLPTELASESRPLLNGCSCHKAIEKKNTKDTEESDDILINLRV